MFCLTRSTDPSWVTLAIADLDAVLVDHAHCEVKAATNALSLAARATSHGMALALAALAEEEVRHFREVLAELGRRGITLGLPPQDKYAGELRAIAHRTAPGGRSPAQTLVDRLLVAALIEARSCERFGLLRDALTANAQQELAGFYDELFACEARHYRTLVDLAIEAGGGDHDAVRARLSTLAQEEGTLAATLGANATIHG